jgi:hypothetical protein
MFRGTLSVMIAFLGIPHLSWAAPIAIGTTDASISWTNVGGSGSPVPDGTGEGGNRDESGLVNFNNITAGPPQTHGATINDGSNSNLTQQTGGLLIDLGSPMSLGAMQIWNFNLASFTGFGSTRFDLYVSTDPSAVALVAGQLQVADLSKFSQVTNNTPLALAPGAAGYLGETFLFGGPDQLPSIVGDHNGTIDTLFPTPISARYVFLNDLFGNTQFGGRLGFSEIQFFQAVPEPSTIAIWLCCAVVTGLAWQWRRFWR